MSTPGQEEDKKPGGDQSGRIILKVKGVRMTGSHFDPLPLKKQTNKRKIEERKANTHVDNSSKSYHEPEGLLNHLLDEVDAPLFDEPNESFNPLLDALQSPLPEDPKKSENEAIVLLNTSEVKEPEIEVLSSVVLQAEVPALKTFKRKLKPGKCLLSPYTDPTVRRKRKAPLQVELIETVPKSARISLYNPNEIQPADVILKFNNWYRKPRNSASPEKVILNFSCLGKARPEWFKDIASRRGMLSNLHIDVLLNMLLIKSSISPESFLHNWTIMESYGSLKLLHKDYESSLPILRMYAEGIRPERGAKAWQDVDKVFGVAHVLSQHWVAYELDLEKENIIIYDSLCTAQSWVEVSQHFKHACHHLPILCKDTNVHGKKGGKTEFKNVWDLIRFENTPQQENHFDCGIMVVKFIESLAADFPVDKIDSKMTAKFRDSFCAEVFSLGKVQDSTSAD